MAPLHVQSLDKNLSVSVWTSTRVCRLAPSGYDSRDPYLHLSACVRSRTSVRASAHGGVSECAWACVEARL
eukprot:6189934-Pleurochrysis_carterae.AAC.2